MGRPLYDWKSHGGHEASTLGRGLWGDERTSIAPSHGDKPLSYNPFGAHGFNHKKTKKTNSSFDSTSFLDYLRSGGVQ
jgi:hypothetical protein